MYKKRLIIYLKIDILLNIMKKHKGEIIELAIRNSGYSLKQVAKRMGISRSTLYNRFDDIDISDDFILTLSQVIHHDFSKEFSHLKDNTLLQEAQEGLATYKKTNHAELLILQKKYCQLLEAYSKLLKIAVKMSNVKNCNLSDLQKEIIGFIEENM